MATKRIVGARIIVFIAIDAVPFTCQAGRAIVAVPFVGWLCYTGQLRL